MDRTERKAIQAAARNEAVRALIKRHRGEFDVLMDEMYEKRGLTVTRRGLISEEEKRERIRAKSRRAQKRRTERARAARLAAKESG